MYTMAGGLKATFLASYMNTAVIFIGLVVFITFVFSVQGNCDELEEGDDTQCNYIGAAAELRAALLEQVAELGVLRGVTPAYMTGRWETPTGVRRSFSVGDRGYHVTDQDGVTVEGSGRGAVFRCDSGGENFEMIPCLNDNEDHISLFKHLISKNL